MSAERWEEVEEQVTTRIPGRDDTESFTDDRTEHATEQPTEPSSEAVDPAQPGLRQQSRGLPSAVAEAADAVGQETRASRLSMMPKASPWQRSHAVWHRAGIDWTRQGADARPAHDGESAAPVAPQSPAPAPGRARRARRAVPLAVAGVLVVGIGAYAVQRGEEHKGAGRQAAVDASGMFALDPAARSDGRSQSLAAVAAAGNTVVALGSDKVRGQFLTSADAGRTWRLASVRAADGGEPPPAEFPRRLAGGSGAWVALGGPATGAPAATGTRGPAIGGVVWTSGDGRTWTRQPDASAFRADDQVNALARTSSGFVAVGSGPDGAVVWRSLDGRAWQRTAAGEAKLSGVVRLERFAAIGDTLVAQGTQKRTVTSTVAEGKKKVKVKRTAEVSGQWRSTDGGRGWTAVNIPQQQGSYGTGDGLVAGPGGFFLTREARRFTGTGKKRKRIRYGVAFRSADGAKWAAAGRLTGDDYIGVDRLGGGVEGLAALVRVSGGKTAVMRSADGRTWRRTGDIARPTLTDLAVLPSATVVTGRQGDDAYLSMSGSGSGDIDLATVAGAVQPDRAIAALAPAGGQVVAVGSTNGDAAAWVSRDGRSWHRAQGTGLGGDGAQRLTDVVHGGQAWLAVGSGGAEPLVMTSADATAWRRVSGLAGDLRPAGAAYGPAGYVVVGRAGAAAATWRSADLKAWTRGFGDLDDATRMSDVAAVSSGYVAVGGVTRDKVQRPAVWTSPDGRRWSVAGSVPLPPGATPGALNQVVARGDTLVARSSSFVAMSADGGRSWQSQALQGATAVAVTPSGFVVAGAAGAPGRTDVVLWSSADGRAWRSIRPHGTGLDGPGAQRLTALAALGEDVLGVGITGDHRGDRPTLWRTRRP